MKNNLFLNNFIYFNSEKFNLTSKVGLWMNAKTDVCGLFSKLYHHPVSPGKVRDESELGIKSNCD